MRISPKSVDVRLDAVVVFLVPANADRQFPGHPEAKVLIKLNKEKDEVRKPGYLEAVKLKGETGEGYSGPGAKATGKMVPQGTRSSEKFLKKSHRMDSKKRTSGF